MVSVKFRCTEIETFDGTTFWFYEEQRKLFNSPNEVFLPWIWNQEIINKIKRRY